MTLFYEDLLDRYGACPLELGVIGRLADRECPHMNLPGQGAPIDCDCWTPKLAVHHRWPRSNVFTLNPRRETVPYAAYRVAA